MFSPPFFIPLEFGIQPPRNAERKGKVGHRLKGTVLSLQ